MSSQVDLRESSEAQSSQVEEISERMNMGRVDNVNSFPLQKQLYPPEMSCQNRKKLYGELNKKLQKLVKESVKRKADGVEVREVIECGRGFSIRELIHCRYSNKLRFIQQQLEEEEPSINSQINRVLKAVDDIIQNTNKYKQMKHKFLKYFEP